MSDHFENKIREKLQQADFPFDPDAWSKMENKLNAVTPPAKRRRGGLGWWISGMALLLVISAGTALWYNSHDSRNYVDKVGETTAGHSHKPGNSDAGKTALMPPPLSVDASKVDEVNHNDSSGKSNINSKHINKVHKQPVSDAMTEDAVNEMTGSPSANTAAAGHPVKKVNNAAPGNTTSVESSNVDNATLATGSGKTTVVETIHVNNASININNVNGHTPKDIEISDALTEQPTQLTLVLQEKQRAERHGFSLGVAVGPDYSVAPSLQFGKFGVSAGLQLQYAFNNRIAVSTGAFYARKLYGATAADYQSPYPFKKVDADCKVLDVPLNLHVTLLESGKHSWAATVGSSSYFMLREDYNMYYTSSNVHKYVYENGSQHYFSMLNLGISYQQLLARHVMWGLQPYAKIPLSGIGHGGVKLSSFGIMLHVNLTQY